MLLTTIAAGWVPWLANAAGTDAGEQDYYPNQQVWGPLNSGSENISLFIYRDIDGNGTYDWSDPPMMNIAVKLYRPNGSQVVRRSNQYGFVNFVNSLTIPGVDIDEVGEYGFEVMLPGGWRVTSGNTRQTAVFEQRSHTRPGVVADRVPHPVGLAPRLEITGHVATRTNNGELEMVAGAMIDAVAPSGESVALVADDMGRFTIEAATGTWMLRAGLPGTTLEIERRVDVAHTPVRLATLVLGDESLPQAAHRQTVDFDAVTDALITKMPIGPAGLEWTNLVIAENRLYHGAGYVNNTVSGNYIGYNSSGYPVTIEHDIAFDFVGAWFGVAWPQAEGEVLEVRAWRGTQRVGEEAFELSTLGPVWFDADYRGITRLELATRHYWQFVMDGPRFGFPD